MSHFYKVNKNGHCKLASGVTSPTKARKSGAMASVTTMLGVMPNDFLNKWSRNQIWIMANTGLSFEECEHRRYGLRRDVDGRMVTSAKFGTNVHKALELHLERMADGDISANNGPYSAYVNPFAIWFRENDYSLVEAEAICYSVERKTAGTIDVLAKDADGKFVLMDFKTRAVRHTDKPESKTYLKDAAQLAVEADIIRVDNDLDYTPQTISVVIAAGDGRLGIRHWPTDKQSYALEVFDACANLYLTINKL